MSLLKRLLGGGPKPEAKPEIYKDFQIVSEPMNEGGSFRVAARIEKEIDGDVKIHHMIRADMIANEDEARDTAIFKAKQLIDQQGDQIFD